jgi:hypothetical protein
LPAERKLYYYIGIFGKVNRILQKSRGIVQKSRGGWDGRGTDPGWRGLRTLPVGLREAFSAFETEIEKYILETY